MKNGINTWMHDKHIMCTPLDAKHAEAHDWASLFWPIFDLLTHFDLTTPEFEIFFDDDK
jgi:hypothetical protein